MGMIASPSVNSPTGKPMRTIVVAVSGQTDTIVVFPPSVRHERQTMDYRGPPVRWRGQPCSMATSLRGRNLDFG
jgi:hypothetical protein